MVCFHKKLIQFLERMQLDYHTTAQENKCYVVGACGFDSIPADMGTVFLEEKFDGQVNSVETYLSLKAKKVIMFFVTKTVASNYSLIFDLM